MSEILTPGHPKWVEFCDRLGGPEFCDFRDTESGGITFNCSGETDRPGATKILAEMEGIDVAASLEWMSENGGYCDCEILFNCDPDDEES